MPVSFSFHIRVFSPEGGMGGFWRGFCWALTRAQKMVKLKWEALVFEWSFNLVVMNALCILGKEIFNIWMLQLSKTKKFMCFSDFYFEFVLRGGKLCCLQHYFPTFQVPFNRWYFRAVPLAPPPPPKPLDIETLPGYGKWKWWNYSSAFFYNYFLPGKDGD